MSDLRVNQTSTLREPGHATELGESNGAIERLRIWLLNESPWWLVSGAVHCVVFVALALVSTNPPPAVEYSGAVIEADYVEQNPEQPEFEALPPIVDFVSPPPLNIDLANVPAAGDPLASLDDREPASAIEGGGTPTGRDSDVSLLGIGTGFDVKSFGPGPLSMGGPLGNWGKGEGRGPGRDGDSIGIRPRDDRVRKALGAATGDTRPSRGAVAGGLDWISRHQLADGRWSFGEYPKVCRDATCTGTGQTDADTAATALGLLPYFAAGQTHLSKGPYRQTITNGLAWLIRRQKPDGDLRGGSTMYAHGLATIALCEAYGMTGDKAVGYAAQSAINFIQRAQNQKTGGWRYQPGDEGDTSVVGWQLMALKSGLMAGLNVDPAALEGVKRWLKSVDKSYGSQFSYRPEDPASPTMSSVGLLCAQYLGARRDEPSLVAGNRYLMSHTPERSGRNLYYWYYATQVMHNLGGPDWDTWNRQMRRTLIESQNKTANLCANGSWDPAKPTTDTWGQHGGRLMMTSLATLTLEVYYRYLPLYKLNCDDEAPPAPAHST